jgi:hypothetical protein
MSIPYAREYTAHLSGATLKSVRCERCHAEYVYRMERDGSGSGTSLLFLDNQGARDRAAQQAADELGGRLRRECDAVPCPACGWYQRAMIDALRRDHRGWMQDTGLVLLAVSVIGLTVAYVNWLPNFPHGPVAPWLVPWSLIGGVIAGVAGVGLLVARVKLAERYDPSANDPWARIAAGRSRAVLKGELELRRDQLLSASEAEERRAREFLGMIGDPPIGDDPVRADPRSGGDDPLNSI